MAKAGLLFVGTDDGIVLFSNPGAIGRWLRIGHELRGSAFRAVWPLADNPLVVFAAVEGLGLQRSDDGGQSWRTALGGDVYSIAGHHSAVEMLYLGAADGQVYRSRDAGANWDVCPQGERPADGGTARVVVGDEDPRRVYLGRDDGVWISEDEGDTWARYGTGLPGRVAALGAAPAQPGLLYSVATGGLYRCTGAQERWERAGMARPDSSAALAILAGRDAVLLMALADGAGLGRSADDGATWDPVGAEAGWSGGVTTIAPAHYHMDTAFAGSAGGQLALSTDRGRTWQMLKQDLPPVRCIAAARLA